MKMMSEQKIVALTAVVMLLVGLGGEVGSAEPQAVGPLGENTHGRFAVGAYHVADDAASNSYDVNHFYYRIISKNLFGHENISLNLDGRARQSGYDYQSGIPNNRLMEANIQIENVADHFDLRLGRSFIEQFPSQSVDGADLKYWLDKQNGVGIFGGARPDPYLDEVNLDYTTLGAYAFTRTDLFGLSAGYANDTYKGEKDRERANAAIYFMPATQEFHLSASVEADNNFDAYEEEGGVDGWSITNMLIHGNFRPIRPLLVSFSYAEFRAINREASFEQLNDTELFTEEYYSISRVSAEVRPTKNYGIYGGGDMRHREVDGKETAQFYGGIRSYNFLWDTRWDIRYSDLGWFTSRVTALYGSIGITKGSFDADISMTQMTSVQDDQIGDLNQTVYDFRANYWLTKNLYATLLWSYSQERYLDIDSIYSSRFADNFTTTTLYGQLGYRF